MHVIFTPKEIRELFKQAILHRESKVAALALKAAREIGADSYDFLSEVLEELDLFEQAYGTGLALFASYGRLDILINLLRKNSTKVKLEAIWALDLLKDPKAIPALQEQINPANPPLVRLRAEAAFEVTITLSRGTFGKRTYEIIPLGPLEAEDIALADLLLKRDISGRKASDLVAQLFHPDEAMRLQARDTLIRMGKKVADDLFDALSTIKKATTKEVIDVLGECQDERGAAIVIAWHKSQDQYTGYKAVKILGDIGGDEAALYIAELIVKENYYDRYTEILQGFNRVPVAYLLKSFGTNENFRRTGAKTLVTLVGIESLAVLIEGIQDRYRETRNNAAEGLMQLKYHATEALLLVLQTSDREEVKLLVCQLLGRIGDVRALTALKVFTTGEHTYLHKPAIEAIGNIADPLSTELLCDLLLDTDDTTRLLIVNGLGKQRDAQAAFVLMQASVNNRIDIRLAAISSLSRIVHYLREQRIVVVESLLRLLNDQSKEVSDLAEERLTELCNYYNDILDYIKEFATTSSTFNAIKIYKRVEKIRASRFRQDFSLLCAEDKKPSPPTSDIPRPITDEIEFAVSAPRTVMNSRSFILDVWAYFGSYKNEIKELAQRAQRDRAIHLRSKGPVKIERNTTLNVQIQIPDFNIALEDTIYWGGNTGNCTFEIKVPRKNKTGFYVGTATFNVGPLQIAKLHFDIEIGNVIQKSVDITSRLRLIKSAFASYASEDRNKVLGRIQGMLKLVPGLDIFLDVASLRSGDHWEIRLEKEIRNRDIFYLFWSRAASQSPWVDKEWRTALAIKGINGIDPVPLEPEGIAKPPSELASLHFNEWTLAFEK